MEAKMKQARRAVLVAEAVMVLCPYCEGTQPAPNGSDFWIESDFVADRLKPRACVECEQTFKIEPTVRPRVGANRVHRLIASRSNAR